MDHFQIQKGQRRFARLQFDISNSETDCNSIELFGANFGIVAKRAFDF